MKKILFILIFILISGSLFANESIADIHIGLGFEISTMGFGFASANSVVSKIGEIGFGGTAGVGWGLFDFFSESFMMPFFWSLYLSYEYPGWFGAFFSYGWYNKKYTYIYDSGVSYSGGIINMYDHAEVGRNFIAFGLQKTFYSSYYLDRWEYVRGSYIGDPSTWRSGYWRSPGVYSYSLNVQAGIKYDMKHTSIEHSSYFVPINPDSLYKSIVDDDNKIGFYIGLRVNYDFPFSIDKKTKE